jgi:hypothetical protein
MHPIFLLKVRIAKFLLYCLKPFVGCIELILVVVQKCLVIGVSINKLFAEVAEMPHMPKHVEFEEKNRIMLEPAPAFNFPLETVSLIAQLVQANPPALEYDITGLSYR